jgi:tripartite-type tricarboxylate transporter receptor subunit TctC
VSARTSFLLAAVLIAASAVAQDYPAKPVRILAGAAPGGNPDLIARLLAAKLADAFGRPFIVEDVPGAGGVVAAETVARAPADGHVLMVGSSSALAINIAVNPNVTYHPLRDFAPITALAAVPSVLIAHPSVPAASLQDLVALARSKPGALTYGSAGVGSIHHLTMAAFMARAGIDLVHVPYKGGTALVAGVLGGQVQAGWSGIPNVVPHIRAGKLRVYAISTASRSAMLAEVPTAAELGYPGFDIATVIGLQAPAGTPREIVARLQAATAKALRDKDVAERMHHLGMELMENGTEHYARFLKEDLERYAMAVRAAGMKHD